VKLLLILFFSFNSYAFNLKDEVDHYKKYNLNNLYTKLVNDHGDGYEPLYGTRNFRAVLQGVYYRGGSNNKYNKYGSRGNMNPLPKVGLDNLCDEGFSTAIYFYTTGFDKAPKLTRCGEGQLSYLQNSIMGGPMNQKALLTLIFKRIKGELPGPIYGGCWNGWHASGLAGALALRQFCGWSGDDADAYWVRNTDGNHTGYDKLRNIIRTFKQIPELKITQEEAELICPN